MPSHIDDINKTILILKKKLPSSLSNSVDFRRKVKNIQRGLSLLKASKSAKQIKHYKGLTTIKVMQLFGEYSPSFK